MNTFEQAIGAGATITFPGGRQFLLLSTSSGVDVRFFNPKNNPSEYAKGLDAGFKATFKERFLKVEITSASAQTVKVGISDIADCSYDRSVGDVDANVMPGSVIDSFIDQTVAAGANAVLTAANSDSRRVVLTGDANNVATLRISTNDVAANRGFALAPGQTVILEVSGSLRAHNPGAFTCTVFGTSIRK